MKLGTPPVGIERGEAGNLTAKQAQLLVKVFVAPVLPRRVVDSGKQLSCVSIDSKLAVAE